MPLTNSDLTSVEGMNLFDAKRFLTYSIDTSKNSVTITDGCRSYREPGLTGIIDFTLIQNPNSIKPTSSLSIFIKDSNQFAISGVSTGITYTATVGQMSQILIAPQTTTVNTLTPIAVQFLPDHSLPVSSRIVITFPNDCFVQNQPNQTLC